MSLMDWLRDQAGLSDADGSDAGDDAADDVTAEPAPATGDSGHLAMLAMIEKQFEAEIAGGNMTPARQQMLTSVLRDLRATLERPGGGVGDLVRKDSEVRALLARMTEAVGAPTRPKDRPGPRAGTRAARLRSLVREMEARVLSAHQRPHPADGERAALQNIHLRCIEAKNAVHELVDDQAAIGLEREVLRPLALDVRRYALRNHITVARPVWPAQPIPQSPNAIYYSGGAVAGDVVKASGDRLRFDVTGAVSGADAARRAWDGLRRSHVAVFDLSGGGEDDESAVRRASTCYELGIALALGRAIVVLASPDSPMPFDVDIEPVLLHGGGEDAAAVAEAIDSVVFVHDRGGADSSLDETVAYVRTGAGLPAGPLVAQTIAMLDGETARDPVSVAQLLDHAFGFAGPEAPRILHPAFPGDYPADEARLFHVMPFGPSWAGPVMAGVRTACDTAGVRYVRGDQVLDPDVIRSIWDELCTATHVLVDMTGLNPNVALELGVAHVLGRNVMVVTQRLADVAAVPALTRIRAHTYDAGVAGRDGIEGVVGAFVSPKL